MQTTNTTALAVRPPAATEYLPEISPEAIEQALAIGDMGKMTNAMRVSYYIATCQSVGLNPYTRPFDLIKGDDGQIRMYPNKVAAEQQRKMYRVSTKVTERRMDAENGLYIVTVQVFTPDGREDEAQGVVDIAGKKGLALANCLKRAETQAKRRATFSLCGLGYEDSEDAPGHPVRFDLQQGTLATEALSALPSPRLPQTLRQLSDDLYGDTRDMPNFTREVPKVALTPPDARVDTPQQPTDDPEALQLMEQIDAAWRAFGLSEAQRDSYWNKAEAQEGVSLHHMTPIHLRNRLGDVQLWIAKQPKRTPEPEPRDAPPAWRAELTALLATFRGDDALLNEMFDAVDHQETPDAVGQAVLAQAQAQAAIAAREMVEF